MSRTKPETAAADATAETETPPPTPGAADAAAPAAPLPGPDEPPADAGADAAAPDGAAQDGGAPATPPAPDDAEIAAAKDVLIGRMADLQEIEAIRAAVHRDMAALLEHALTEIGTRAVPARLSALVDELRELDPDGEVGADRGGLWTVRLYGIEAVHPDAYQAFSLWSQKARRKIMKLREV